MDSSMYYDGREDGDSPILSPLTPNFDGYVPRGAIDESPYITDASYAPVQSDSYTMSGPPRGGVDQRDSGGFSLDFLPTGDTIPRAYPGTIDPSSAVRTSPNPTWDMDGTSPALYQDRDSSEEVRLQSQYGQSFDNYTNEGYPGFLPSPPDGPYQAGSSSRKKTSSSDKKRRRHQSSAKDRDDKPHRPTTQLRTASRAPKRYSQATARRPAESPEEVKARAAHNQVEQQYRKRLNQQFERLLAVLPQPDYDEEGEDGEMADGCSGKGLVEKRISKAEVLDLARRRIKVLEKERASLEKQKRDLANSVVRLQDEWSRRAGNGSGKSEGRKE